MVDTSAPTMMVPVVVCPVAGLMNWVGKAVSRQWPPPDSAGTVTAWPVRPAAQPGLAGIAGGGMMFDWDGMTANWGCTATCTCSGLPFAGSQSTIPPPGTSSGHTDEPVV